MDKILEKLGLKYEDLNHAERKTLDKWMETLNQGRLNVESVKQYVVSMREAVEEELSKSDINTKQDIFLKARLRNYLLLEGFLTSPEKAQKEIENAIQGMVGRR